MTIHINGEPREIHDAATVADLPAALAIPASTLLIEHNGAALHRSQWPDATLRHGDNLEILRVIAGG